MLNRREFRALLALNVAADTYLTKSDLPPLTGEVTLSWLIELGLITARRGSGEPGWRITKAGQKVLEVEAPPDLKRKPGRPPRPKSDA